MRLTYRYILYTNKQEYLIRNIEIAAQIWNYCIALHKRYYRLTNTHLHKFKLINKLTKLKKEKDKSHWNRIGSQAIQDIAERVDRSYKLFFRNQRKGIKSSPPTFRSRHTYSSYTLKQAGYTLYPDNRIRIGDQTFKYVKSRPIVGKIKTLTIKRSIDGIYLYFSLEYDPAHVRAATGKIAGLDMGLRTFLTVGTEKIHSPLFLNTCLEKLKRLDQKVSSKQRGGQNRKKVLRRRSRLYRTVTDQRRDWFFKLANRLCSRYDLISIEDLDLGQMKQRWGLKVSDLAYGYFTQILDHQCSKHEVKLVRIDRYFPSSQLCSSCSFRNTGLDLTVTEWVCPNCRTRHDRDVNASENIKREGASSLGTT